jgi:hypothetical protein
VVTKHVLETQPRAGRGPHGRGPHGRGDLGSLSVVTVDDASVTT